MGDKIKAIFKNKDVLNRIMFTFAIFLVYRIGSAITVPGVTLSADAFSGTDALGLLNLMAEEHLLASPSLRWVFRHTLLLKSSFNYSQWMFYRC